MSARAIGRFAVVVAGLAAYAATGRAQPRPSPPPVATRRVPARATTPSPNARAAPAGTTRPPYVDLDVAGVSDDLGVDPLARSRAAQDTYFNDQLNQASIAAGHVDSWYYDFAREIQTEMTTSPEPPGVHGDSSATGSPRWVVDQLHRYSVVPSAPPNPRNPSPTFDGMGTGGPSDPFGAQERRNDDVYNPLNAPTTWHPVTVRLEVDGRGNLLASSIVRSSGVPPLDAWALDAARRAGTDFRPPSEYMVRRSHRVVFELEIGVGDAAPYVGRPSMLGIGGQLTVPCVTDTVRGVQCGRYTRMTFSLRRVEDDDHPAVRSRAP